MTRQRFVKLGALCALLGGVLRIMTSFIPFMPGSLPLELLYAFIDIVMMLGLAAVYLPVAERLGGTGFFFFAVAFTGFASIVGPDPEFAGVSMYQLGTTIIVAGLAGLAVVMLLSGWLRAAALFWLLTFLAGLGYALTGVVELFPVAGILFGTGFILAGWQLLRQAEPV